MSTAANSGFPGPSRLTQFVAKSTALLIGAQADLNAGQAESLGSVLRAVRYTKVRADSHSLRTIASLAGSLEQLLLKAQGNGWNLCSSETAIMNRCLDRLVRLVEAGYASNGMDIVAEKEALHMVDIIHRASGPTNTVVCDDNVKGLRDVVLRCAQDQLQQYSTKLAAGAVPNSTTRA